MQQALLCPDNEKESEDEHFLSSWFSWSFADSLTSFVARFSFGLLGLLTSPTKNLILETNLII